MKLYKKIARACWTGRKKGDAKKIYQRLLRRRINKLVEKEVDELER